MLGAAHYQPPTFGFVFLRIAWGQPALTWTPSSTSIVFSLAARLVWTPLFVCFAHRAVAAAPSCLLRLPALFLRHPVSRTFATVVGGATAGILGLRGVYGGLFYVLLMATTSGLAVAKAGAAPSAYWNRPAAALGVGACLERSLLLSYLLFWSLFFSVAHLYIY